MKENWRYEKVGWSSRIECVEVVRIHGENSRI